MNKPLYEIYLDILESGNELFASPHIPGGKLEIWHLCDSALLYRFIPGRGGVVRYITPSDFEDLVEGYSIFPNYDNPALYFVQLVSEESEHTVFKSDISGALDAYEKMASKMPSGATVQVWDVRENKVIKEASK